MRNYQRGSGETHRDFEHDRLCWNVSVSTMWLASKALARPAQKSWREMFTLISSQGWLLEHEVEAMVGRGFVDVLMELRNPDGKLEDLFVVECKTWADKFSAGDVIRQLKLYRADLEAKYRGKSETSDSLGIHLVLYVPTVGGGEGLPDLPRKLLTRAGVLIVDDDDCIDDRKAKVEAEELFDDIGAGASDARAAQSCP